LCQEPNNTRVIGLAGYPKGLSFFCKPSLPKQVLEFAWHVARSTARAVRRLRKVGLPLEEGADKETFNFPLCFFLFFWSMPLLQTGI
jgi:hypothetical protein